jgi:homoserine O-succinyltransferase
VRTPHTTAHNEDFVMPVFLTATYPGPERRSGLNWPRVQKGAVKKSRGSFLHIGLINNVGDAAMCATEHQFLTLLEASARDLVIYVTLHALPGVERKPFGQRRVSSFYAGIEQLWEQPPEQYPDGLIVTGREPLTPDLRDEAYWPNFQRVLAWAQEHGRSAVWSCLAAHAAVLALDDVERVRSPHLPQLARAPVHGEANGGSQWDFGRCTLSDLSLSTEGKTPAQCKPELSLSSTINE